MSDTFDPYQSWLGIEPHERPLDHYRLLGVAQFETRRDVIQAAADQRMGYVRSFQAGPRVKHTQKLLNELATAKLCLLDASAKSGYDAALRARLAASSAPQAPAARVEALLPPGASLAQPAMLAEPPPPPVQAARPELEEASQPSASHVEQSPESDSPFYTQVWFPAAVGASVLLVIGVAWGIGEHLSRPQETVTEKPLEESPDPEVETPEPEPQSSAATLIEPDANGTLTFAAETATLHGNLKLESRSGSPTALNWQSPDDSLMWEFRAKKPGVYRVEISYAAPDPAGGRYEIAVADKTARREIRSNAKPDEFVTDTARLAITKSGRNMLVLRAAEVRGKDLFAFKSLVLAP